MRVAIIGSGIAAMTVAHRLRELCDLTIFEANDYAGGHTATVDVDWQGSQFAIDTGFIVFNDWTYPNFIALLAELGVPWQYSNMSFSLRCERTGLEYNGTSVNSLFAQRRNLLSLRFWRMIADILRFNASATELLHQPAADETLLAYLTRCHYSSTFRDRYIVPMGKAIWSATESNMLNFPARFFVEFFDKHGFLNVNNRPVWRTVTGGSREYARRLLAPLRDRLRLNSKVVRVERDIGTVSLRTTSGDVGQFDYVVFACHSDQALTLLAKPTAAERAVLGAMDYQANDAILHTDASLLPRQPRARAAWNYHALAIPQDRVALTYDMNVLQNLTAPVRFLLTLNRAADIDPGRVLHRFTYHHPVYTPQAVHAQGRRAEISGHNRSFYCGAYWRYGFHEDGVVSALWAVEDFARVTGNKFRPLLQN